MLTLTGVGFMVIGFFLWIRMFVVHKIIARFPVLKDECSFAVNDMGHYSIEVVGGFKITGLEVDVINLENQNRLDVRENILKYRTLYNWKIAVDHSRFLVDKTGEYKIKINSLANLKVENSMLLMGRSQQKDVAHENIDIVISRTIPAYLKLLSSVFVVIGFNILIFTFSL